MNKTYDEVKIMKVDIYTSYPDVDLDAWDDDTKLPKYTLEIAEFNGMFAYSHPQKLFDLIYSYLMNTYKAGLVSGTSDSDAVVIITYSEVVFNACRVFLHDAKKYDKRIPVELNLHVVDEESELFTARVTSTGKMLAPEGCNLEGIFDCYDRALDRMLDLTHPHTPVNINNSSTDNVSCSECKYSRENYPENRNCPCFTCDMKHHTNFKRYEEFHGAV